MSEKPLSERLEARNVALGYIHHSDIAEIRQLEADVAAARDGHSQAREALRNADGALESLVYSERASVRERDAARAQVAALQADLAAITAEGVGAVRMVLEYAAKVAALRAKLCELADAYADDGDIVLPPDSPWCGVAVLLADTAAAARGWRGPEVVRALVDLLRETMLWGQPDKLWREIAGKAIAAAEKGGGE